MIRPLRILPRAAIPVLLAVATACTAPGPGGGPETPPRYKVGAPYRIGGTWYYPAENLAYDETGIASWYGPDFHGRVTANGEVYDMTQLTAAHRTLPLPSLVQVTNLENGRQVVVRVNDRGPFARSRIIDLSRRAARLLGFVRRGTAKVRVRILPRESLVLKSRALGAMDGADGVVVAAAAPRQAVEVLDDLPSARAMGTPAVAPGLVTHAPVRPSRIFVQAGAFAEPANAHRLRARLARFGAATVDRAVVRGRPYYRVRVGPAATVADGDRLLAAVLAAGVADARLIVD